MIKIFQQMDDISAKLNDMKSHRHINDYRLYMDMMRNVVVYVRQVKDWKAIEGLIDEYHSVSFVEADAPEYDFYFESSKEINIDDVRYKLSNMVEEKSKQEVNEIPLLTFYSYKGGVGRSTALVSFAIYLANCKKMSVVILDCDFEAPGLSNFFLEDSTNISYKNGIVEYLTDSDAENGIKLNNYYWEVSKKYSGDGNIYVFPAGNLDFNEPRGQYFATDLDHYVNGLSLLDTFSKDYLKEKMSGLLSDIKDKLSPDIVVVDSRTGFSDVFGTLGLYMSDIIIGMFGSDAQSKPGLEFLLRTMRRDNGPSLVFAHSIVPSNQKIRLTKYFEEYVSERMNDLSGDDNNDEGPMSVPVFPVSDNDILRNIGKPTESYDEYISMICNQEFADYKRLFEKLYELCVECMHKNENERDGDGEEISRLQRAVLKNTSDNMPPLYAQEKTDYGKELSDNHYYFRACMQDLFNPDKFLVLGSKGTGKSYIYQSLSNSDVVGALKQKANKRDKTYTFVQIVSNKNRFDTTKLNFSEELDSDLYFDRFWQIYIWNVIMASRPYGYVSDLSFKEICDTTDCAMYFNSKIKDDEFVAAIENDMDKLDAYIEEKCPNSYVVFVFDELDNIVKPIQWNQRVSPLVKLCKEMAYSHLFPKLFVRSDLFVKMGNLNNKLELKNRSINIEWSREELFSYFFKFVLSHSRNEFFRLMEIYQFSDAESISKVKSILEDKSAQPPLDDFVLKQLSAAFFGKYADSENKNKYGTSYDWFFTNLKNANDTISLRPFIDLLTKAIEKALHEDDLLSKPILPPKFYTNGRLRSDAVERHIQDLSSEDGNKDLIEVLKLIRDKVHPQYKKDFLCSEKFDSLLSFILSSNILQECKTKEDVLYMLIVNGVIRQKFHHFEYGKEQNGYQFALLYKYYLGLRSKKRIKYKNTKSGKAIRTGYSESKNQSEA